MLARMDGARSALCSRVCTGWVIRQSLARFVPRDVQGVYASFRRQRGDTNNDSLLQYLESHGRLFPFATESYHPQCSFAPCRNLGALRKRSSTHGPSISMAAPQPTSEYLQSCHCVGHIGEYLVRRQVCLGISHQKFAVRNYHKDHQRGIHTVRLKRSHAPMLTRVSEPTPVITLLQKNCNLSHTRNGFFHHPASTHNLVLSRHRRRHKELRMSIQPAIFELPEHHQQAKFSQCVTHSHDRLVVKGTSDLSNDVLRLWC